MIFISILSFILGNNSFYIKSKSVPLIVGGSQMSSRMSDGIYYTGIFNYTISDEKHSTKVRIGIGYKKDMKDKYIINLNLTSWHNVTCPKFYLTNFTSQHITKIEITENDLHKTMTKFTDLGRPIPNFNYINLTGYISHIISKSTIVVRARYPRIICSTIIKNREHNYGINDVELITHEIFYEEKNGSVIKKSKKTHLC